MKKVCSWCGKAIKEYNTKKDGETHGICKQCMHKFINEEIKGTIIEYVSKTSIRKQG